METKKSKVFDITSCTICPASCGIDRRATRGKCGVDAAAYVGSYQPHYWEEPPISGTRGSGAIFFSGCNMRCVFCQNSEISRKPTGERCDYHRLIEIFHELEGQKVHNINLVTPTPHLSVIYEALTKYKPQTVVYNSGGYEKAESINALNGLVDVYLPDLKYSDDELAYRYSGIKAYSSQAISAIDEMIRQQPKAIYDSCGIMTKGVIVRHLVLPNQRANTEKVIRLFAERYKDKAVLSLMSQYTPKNNLVGFTELQGTVKPLEYKLAVRLAEKLGITDCFIQEADSADGKYIPQLLNNKGNRA